MGTVFRRSYHDKRTGKTRRVRTYSIKYKSSAGIWITEPTETTIKAIALRILLERERHVAGVPLVASMPTTIDAAANLIDLNNLIEEYLAHFQLRVRPLTFKRRSEYLFGTIKRWCIASPTEMTSATVQKYVRDRLAASIMPQTINLEFRYLRCAFAWAVGQKLLTDNPLQVWEPLLEAPRRHRRAMLPEEVTKLLAVSPVWRRVIWAVFLASGLRRSELLQLQIDDFDQQTGLIVVRPEISKTNKMRRVFLPRGLVDLLVEYLGKESQQRRHRQDAYLCETQQRLAKLETAGWADIETAEKLRALEDHIRTRRGHTFLFVNSRGLPIQLSNNLLRSFRADLRRAKIDPVGLDLHSMRRTANTVMLKGSIPPAVVRARLGHSSASMTSLYTDPESLDRGGHTAAIAQLLGVSDGDGTTDDSGGKDGKSSGKYRDAPLTLDEGDLLRPTAGVLAAMVERFSNLTIARVCRVSEMSVRKWLKKFGIVRQMRVVTKNLPESHVALLRADLRAALAVEETGRE